MNMEANTEHKDASPIEQNPEQSLKSNIAAASNGDCPQGAVDSSRVVEDSDSDDDFTDLDSLEVSPSLDESLKTDLSLGDSQTEACKKIMIVCSNAAQNIKKSITDALSSRECATVEELDPTGPLQASLDEHIADFEKTVSVCLATDPPKVDSCFEITEITDEDIADPVSDTLPEGDVAKVPEENAVPEAPDCKPNTCDAKEVPVEVAVAANVPNQKIDNQDSASQTQNSVKSTTKSEERNSKKQKNVPSKKKIEKNIDALMKSLSALPTAEERVSSLCRKYAELQEDYRLVDPRLKQLERQVMVQQREKEMLQADHNRIILAKSRLEGLCREMQRQNKVIKEESLQRIREEEEKRKEVANKFQVTLNDISSLMQENSKKNVQLREENAELALKLKGLVENYEVWEQNMQKIIQQKELEAQLAKAKHAKVNLLLKTETEKFLHEKKSLLEGQSELQKRCTMLAQNELQLRTELAEYTAKYEEFQSVLTNSSKVFTSFKHDMDATSKKIKKLEKETTSYKQKWTSSNNALLEMITYKEKQDKEFANSQQRIGTLEKLCRALQAERNDLQNKLNASHTSELTSISNSSITSSTNVSQEANPPLPPESVSSQ